MTALYFKKHLENSHKICLNLKITKMTTGDKKKLIEGLIFLANVGTRTLADKQTHAICEEAYNEIKKFLDDIQAID